MPDTRDLKPTGKGQWSDADRMMDCLASARERALLYARAALESTNNGVREFFLAMHGEETHNQEILFSFLHTRGFYPTDQASQGEIDAVKQRYQKIRSQLALEGAPPGRRYHTADPKLPPAYTQDPGKFQYKQH